MPTMGATSHHVEAQETSRVSGCSCPWHPFQFIAWAFLFFFGFIFFTIVAPSCLKAYQYPVYVIPTLILAVHLLFHVITIALDPAHENVRNKYKSTGNRSVEGKFDRANQRHVIQEDYCCLCEVNVNSNSKHCRSCNKCIDNFDHHCKWLNNCIGDRNYKLFIITLVTALVDIIVVFVCCFFLIIAVHVDTNCTLIRPYYDYVRAPMKLNSTAELYSNILGTNNSVTTQVSQGLPADGTYNSTLPPSTTLSTVSSTAPFNPQGIIQESGATDSSTQLRPCPDDVHHEADFLWFGVDIGYIAFLTILIVTTLLALVTIGLLGHLLIFHIVLMCRGLTTFQWIQQSREKAEQKASQKEIPADNYDPYKNKAKNTQVAPAPDSYELETDLPSNNNSHSEDSCGGGVLAETERAVRESESERAKRQYTARKGDASDIDDEGTPVRKDERRRRKKKANRLLSKRKHPLGTDQNGHVNTSLNDDSRSLRAAIRLQAAGLDSDASTKNVSDVAVSMSQDHTAGAKHQARLQHLLSARAPLSHRQQYTDSDSSQCSLQEIPVSSTRHNLTADSHRAHILANASSASPRRSPLLATGKPTLPPLTTTSSTTAAGGNASPHTTRSSSRRKKRRVKKRGSPRRTGDTSAVGGNVGDMSVGDGSANDGDISHRSAGRVSIKGPGTSTVASDAATENANVPHTLPPRPPLDDCSGSVASTPVKHPVPKLDFSSLNSDSEHDDATHKTTQI